MYCPFFIFDLFEEFKVFYLLMYYLIVEVFTFRTFKDILINYFCMKINLYGIYFVYKSVLLIK